MNLGLSTALLNLIIYLELKYNDLLLGPREFKIKIDRLLII